MINIRQSIYDLLSTIPNIGCHTSRIDPFKSDRFPVISVQYNNIDRKQIGDNLTYRVNANTSIIVCVATTDNDFDTQLDTLVDNVLTKLLTDVIWDTQFEYVRNINTKYGYVQAGDTDLSTAYINFETQHTEVYDPNVTAMWDKTHIDIDFIKPFDPNLASIGPDGRLEATIEITTS